MNIEDMIVVAKRGTKYVLSESADLFSDAVVHDSSTGITSKTMKLGSILARGYWQEQKIFKKYIYFLKNI